MISFEVGEVVHLWEGGGYIPAVPQEVTVTKISQIRITVRDLAGESRFFRTRDRREFGSMSWCGAVLEKLDREKAEWQREAREVAKLRAAIFKAPHMGLKDMQRWSADESTLRALAGAYRTFLRDALAIGADVPTELREWLEEDA